MFQFIGFVVRYLPIVVAAVQVVEGVVSKDTDGATKKELATNFVIDALDKFGVKVTDRLRDVIGDVIDLVVSALNFFGIFKHGADIAPGEDISAVSPTEVDVARSETEERLAELERVLSD